MMRRSLVAVLMIIAGTCSAQTRPTTQPAHPAPRDATLPTVWLVGDSTVHNGSGNGALGQWGWGDRIARFFDTSRINLVNAARGGRSSRTFQTEGLWDAVLADAKRGDFVIIQMGHNDGGAIAGDNRERGTLPGVGAETQDVTLTLP